jgi:hypothetical protein
MIITVPVIVAFSSQYLSISKIWNMARKEKEPESCVFISPVTVALLKLEIRLLTTCAYLPKSLVINAIEKF